jgi:hypothetical protein
MPTKSASITSRRSPSPRTSACLSEKHALEGLGQAYLVDGNPSQAAEHQRQALLIYY